MCYPEPVRARSLFACALVAASVLAAERALAEECASSPLPPDPPGVKTRASIEKVGTRYRATLDIESARSRGERVLEADSCEALAKAAAVVVAMAVAPDREDTKPKAEETAAPAPIEERPVDRDVAPRREERAPARFALRADAVADSAMMPGLAAGLGVALGLEPIERLHLELHGALFAEQEGRVDAGRGATFTLLSGGARACWALTRGVEIAPCAGLDVGRLGATGFGAQRVADGGAVVVAPEGLVALRVPLAGPIGLRAGLGVLAPISRQSFVITARGTIHEVPAITVRGFLGPEVRF